MYSQSKIIEEDLNSIAGEIREFYPVIEGKTFLIAGGAGFLGRYMVMSLNYLNEMELREPCKIIIVDNFISGLKDWIPSNKNITLIEHDISKPLKIKNSVDYVVNFASIASPVFYNKHRLETIEAGIFGTRNLLELAKEKHVRSFLFASSSEIYGEPDSDNIPTKEEYRGNVSCIGPRACYDEPKRMGETLCMSYAEIYNLPVKIARPFNIFGPGIRLDDGRVMPTFVSAAIRGKKLPVHGDGKNTRTFCYITNATVGFFKILFSDRNREVYNIGADDHEIQIRHLADIILGLVEHKDSRIALIDETSAVYNKDSNPNRRCPDLSKIRTQLGYNIKVNLISGLKRFIEWVREELSGYDNGTIIEKECRVCGSEKLEQIISFGKTPLANSLLTPDELQFQEELYELTVNLCRECYHCQLSQTVDPDRMFRQYPYVTSTTRTFREHFREMALSIFKDFGLGAESLVVDIGSNDGLLLKSFRELGTKVIGVEPAANIAKIARDNGIETINDYFNYKVVTSIISLKGKADVITANNVFAHTRDLRQFTSNVRTLLKDDGIFIIEVQYFLDTLKNLTFDNIYHEHLSYFTLISLNEFFLNNGMEIFHVRHVDSHGGSLRVFTQRKHGKHRIENSVREMIDAELEFGLNRIGTYKEFARKVYNIRDRIREYVSDINKKGGLIAGYGAPAKATTLLNFCGLNQREIKFIVDDNPMKQGLVVPGVRIPIQPRTSLAREGPDFILILAWNFADEIISNNRKDLNGAKFIIPLPEPRIV